MAGGSTRRAAVGLLALSFALAPWQAAKAIEAFDGRIQVHGFVEEQVRVLDGSFNEEADLAQWYNVLTLENEFDIAPNGFGPIDLLQAYVRIEARYDCIWTHGCGMFESVNTYGNDAKRLPQRLRDARDQDYGGTIPTGTPLVPQEVPRIQNDRPASWAVLRVIRNEPVGGTDPAQWTPDQALFNGTWIKNTCQVPPGIGYQPTCAFGDGPWNRQFITIVEDRQGFPGLDTLFRTRGADAELSTNQDTGVNDDPANYTFGPVIDHVWALRSRDGPDGGAGRTMVLGPWLPKNAIRTLGTLHDRANPFRGITPPTRNGLITVVLPGNDQMRRVPDSRTTQFPAPLSGAPYPTTDPNGDILDQRVVDFFLDPVFGYNQGSMARFPDVETNIAGARVDGTGFGGDFSGIVPTLGPEVNFSSDAQKLIRNDPTLPQSRKTGAFPGTNIRAIGGTSELPARPAPDKSNLEPFDQQVAQGLYLPSSNLRRALREQDFDNHEFSFTETELSWNHGQSQQDTYEVKEAYVDFEVLDSRLWGRFGLQNIVWGKTELFRTTDQFNPQDLALASLASLEESRIALFAGRLVYSLYDVGPLEDVRAEFAFNFDDYQPADLGACGEPFTPDVVCGITTGLFFHGVTGVGIVGVDRPPDPWDSIKGLEIGGRLEWRWDRFSFALMDFWGYSDFPYPDAINYYERNVDPETGRPRIAGATGSCRTAGVFLVTNGSPGTPLATGPLPGIPAGFSARSLADPQVPQGMQGGLGMGVDPDCLKAGGAAGGLSENRWNDEDGDYEALLAWYADPVNNPLPVLYDGLGQSPQNALENHAANQQIFAWICSGTVTIAAAVDPGACAWSIFTTAAPLPGLPVPLNETMAAVFAGDHTSNVQEYLNTYATNTKGLPNPVTPVRNLNDDYNDGIITALNPAINSPNQIFGIQFNDNLTLDSTLTNEQRALLGCGPFYGTRCDSGVGGNFRDPFTGAITNYQGQGWNVGGGMDVLNAEASAILQAFPGFEGTAQVGLNGLTRGVPWTTTNRDLTQPGTIGFEGGPVCTRYVNGQLVKLPGCRGVQSLELDSSGAFYRAVFDNGYNVAQDGCVFGVEGVGMPNQAVSLNGRPINASREDGSAVDLSTCGVGPPLAQTTQFSHTRDAPPGQNGYGRIAATNFTQYLFGARTLFHPLAGCLTAAEAAANTQCDFPNRDFNAEFGAGNAQIFSNELAAFSWNLMMFLITAGSCDQDERSIALDPECFNPNDAWRDDKCGYAAPQYCASVKGFLGVGGVNRNKVEAGGNARFGRRDFLWHSGGELALRYAKRNVFGLSTDFAEDVTKTNWSLEFTWIGATPYLDADDFEDGITDSDSLNLTISVDRPTFINFLNANRTFFFNTQWFFQYLTNYSDSFSSNGPFNVLFTFAVFTGYFQDRLLPTMVSVYDFRSRSGGFLPSITYRFNEAFSITTGVNLFWGRVQYKDMPVRAFAPTSNRAGTHAYEDGTEQVLGVIHRRDEVFLRLRYTF